MNFSVETNASEVVFRLRDLPAESAQRVDGAANAFVQRITRDARRDAPEAESNLTNSILVKRNGLMDYETGPNVNYGPFVELGSEPGGVPPLQSLIDWLRVRRITPDTKGFDLTDLAYAIQAKIKRRGVDSQPYMLPALEANRRFLDGILRRYLSSGR